MPVTFTFFFNDTATTEIYTLSLHDALPISARRFDHLEQAQPFRDRRLLFPDPCEQASCRRISDVGRAGKVLGHRAHLEDPKSTRLNSSHVRISYAGFCLENTNKPS